MADIDEPLTLEQRILGALYRLPTGPWLRTFGQFDQAPHLAAYLARELDEQAGGPQPAAMIAESLAWLVKWNDQHGVPEIVRMLKIAEEYGEATQAYYGCRGLNPRKGVTSGLDEVRTELADTALSALVALESIGGDAEGELLRRIAFVKARLEATSAPEAAETASAGVTAPDTDEAVRTWRHSRKGLVRGVIVGGDATWVRIRLVGDQTLRYYSEANRGRVDEDGDVMTLRRVFLTEVSK